MAGWSASRAGGKLGARAATTAKSYARVLLSRGKCAAYDDGQKNRKCWTNNVTFRRTMKTNLQTISRCGRGVTREPSIKWGGSSLLTASLLALAITLCGCASKQPQSSTVDAIGNEAAATWQNASASNASSTVTATSSTTSVGAAPVPPPNTLISSVTTVGGSVVTKPEYAQYDYGWLRIFAT